MILIAENIHIISKSMREAIEKKDENFVKNLIKISQNFDAVDLNIGPAKGKLDMAFEWLCPLVENENASLGISFDTSNTDAMKRGLAVVKNSKNCFINSTSADDEKLEYLTDLALEYDCNLVALAMSKETGIPKTSDMRMELIFKIYEKCIEKGISPKKIFFDPLILPVCVEQSQALEVLNTVQIINQSFEDGVNTLVGLSNISNGCNSEIRLLLNRAYAVLLFGAGLKAAIIDAKDEELYRIFKMLECNNPQNEIDKLYINLSNMVQYFGDVEDIPFNKEDPQQSNIIRAVRVLLNKEIYSDRFTQV